MVLWLLTTVLIGFVSIVNHVCWLTYHWCTMLQYLLYSACWSIIIVVFQLHLCRSKLALLVFRWYPGCETGADLMRIAWLHDALKHWKWISSHGDFNQKNKRLPRVENWFFWITLKIPWPERKKMFVIHRKVTLPVSSNILGQKKGPVLLLMWCYVEEYLVFMTHSWINSDPFVKIF